MHQMNTHDNNAAEFFNFLTAPVGRRDLNPERMTDSIPGCGVSFNAQPLPVDFAL
jgi:hypothetical protein